MSEYVQLPEHSKAKVRLLGEYLKRFLSVISNDGFTREIDIYDLFCGDGLGSPTVIMQEVKNSYFMRQAHGKGNPVINCFFNDKDANKVNRATEIIRTKHLHYLEFGTLQFTNRDYVDIVGELTQTLRFQRDRKTFIFIDPYGYKNIKASQIKSLLEKLNVEILLFLPTQFMYRFDANGTPEALSDFVSEIVDLNNWEPNKSVWSYIEQLKSGFKSNLGSSFYVDTFTIKKDAQTVFCLFFFSRHIKGFEKMLESKWKIDEEEGLGWDYKTCTSLGLLPDQKTNPLETKLLEYFASGPRSNGEVYVFTLQCGFLPKHAAEVFKALQEQNRLSVLNSAGEGVRRGAYYISYDKYKNEPSKVSFQVI